MVPRIASLYNPEPQSTNLILYRPWDQAAGAGARMTYSHARASARVSYEDLADIGVRMI